MFLKNVAQQCRCQKEYFSSPIFMEIFCPLQNVAVQYFVQKTVPRTTFLLQTLVAVGLLCAAASVSGDSNLPVLFQFSQPSHSVSVFRGADLERAKAAGLINGLGAGGSSGAYAVAAPAPPPPPPVVEAPLPPPPPPPPAPIVYRPAPAPLVYRPAPPPVVYQPAPAPVVYRPAPVAYNPPPPPPPAPVAYKPAYVEPEYNDVNTFLSNHHPYFLPLNITFFLLVIIENL